MSESLMLKFSAVTILKFLIILAFNLCFISEVQWENGVWEEIHPYAQLLAASFTSNIEFQRNRTHENSVILKVTRKQDCRSMKKE